MKQRVITGAIAGSFFLTILFIGSYWFSGMIILLALIGYHEFIKLSGLKNALTYFTGLISLLFLVTPWHSFSSYDGISFQIIVWIALFLLLTITVVSKNEITIDKVALIFAGIVYLGYGFHYIINTRLLDPHGLFWTLLILVCLWMTDSGAYFTGMLVGKHPLWPSISPNKTIEGAIGGILFSIITALCFYFYASEWLSFGRALLLAVVIALIGQVGDLLQSAYKRVKGIKDTGSILPGHGGVLDRVDSWLIVFPFVHLFSLIPQ